MATLRKIVGVTLVVVLVAAITAFVLRPTAGPSTSAVVDQPGTATNEPPTPDRLSNGPNHPVCLKANDHIPEHAWVRGANWYRFYDTAACAVSALLALALH